MNSQTKKMTMEGERERFLEAVWVAVNTWGRSPIIRGTVKQTQRDKVMMCANSFLMILDNIHRFLPEYKLTVVDEDGSEIVISGNLHDYFMELDPMENLRRLMNEETD